MMIRQKMNNVHLLQKDQKSCNRLESDAVAGFLIFLEREGVPFLYIFGRSDRRFSTD